VIQKKDFDRIELVAVENRSHNIFKLFSASKNRFGGERLG